MRGKDFWKNFRYAIVIIEKYTDGTVQLKYVTKIYQDTKEFRYGTVKDIKKLELKIPTFPLDTAVELMNSMVCNGYTASITPMFND